MRPLWLISNSKGSMILSFYLAFLVCLVFCGYYSCFTRGMQLCVRVNSADIVRPVSA